MIFITRIIVPVKTGFNFLMRTDEHIQQNTDDTENKSTGNRSPKIHYVKSSDKFRDQIEHKTVNNKSEQSQRKYVQREREQNDDWFQNCIYKRKNYCGDDNRLPPVNLNTGNKFYYKKKGNNVDN